MKNFIPNETSAYKSGFRVKVYDNDVTQAYSRLRRLMQDEGFFDDMKSSRFFESKGQKNRRRKQEAVRRQKKEDRKNERFF